jgi:hypothetical protein
MKFFNAQIGSEEAGRPAARSLRRHNRGDEALAVALELEEVRPTTCSSRCGGSATEAGGGDANCAWSSFEVERHVERRLSKRLLSEAERQLHGS